MANSLTVEMETHIRIMRARTTALEFAIMGTDTGADYAEDISHCTNKILNTALDLSKLAAKVKGAAQTEAAEMLKSKGE